jgi:prepilin-type N-terminal cleavage/methylation domain-containing protein
MNSDLKTSSQNLKHRHLGEISMTQATIETHSSTKRTASARHQGFTLVELLIGMGILGVILVAAAGLLQSNQRVTSDAQTRSNAIGDARGAISRMTETLSQAAYIYPEDSTITFSYPSGKTRQVTTGRDAVAALISSTTPAGSAPQYRGVIYYLADRNDARFTDDLPSIATDRIAQNVLVEATIPDIGWPSATLPVMIWNIVSEGVLVDGVDRTDGATVITDLMATGNFAAETGSDGAIFADGIQGKTLDLKKKEALISTIGYSIGVRVASVGKTLADSGTTVLRGLANARNVPRRLQ